MAAHEDITHTSPAGHWRLRLHADGRAEVLEHRPFTVKSGRVSGLGDLIAAGTGALGVPECKGCGGRRAALNRAVPFRVR